MRVKHEQRMHRKAQRFHTKPRTGTNTERMQSQSPHSKHHNPTEAHARDQSHARQPYGPSPKQSHGRFNDCSSQPVNENSAETAWRASKILLDHEATVGLWNNDRAIALFDAVVAWNLERPHGVTTKLLHDFPWPVLVRPRDINFIALTFADIEEFLKVYRDQKGVKQYIKALKQWRVKLHPDKWGKALQGVQDTSTREQYQEAINLVGKTLMSEWDTYKDKYKQIIG